MSDAYRVVQRAPSPEPLAHINTAAPDIGADPQDSLQTLMMFAQTQGDISDLLTSAQLVDLGVRACREWSIDEGSRADWKERAEKALNQACQEREEDDEREPLWEDGANIRSPMLTLGSLSFAAKASPDLIRGDQVVGIKVWQQPAPQQPQRAAQGPPPQNPQEAQAQQMQAQKAAQQQQQVAQQAQAASDAKNARAQRVKTYLNYLIFYRMDGWEDETDQLLHEAPVVGSGFKKIYMGPAGLCSDYVSATRLTVHNDTKSIYRCPRITQDFEIYPYEIEDRIRAGIYRDAKDSLNLATEDSQDPEKPKHFIEQHRMDDLDGDGLAEPYIVTCDVETKTVLRVEPAYSMDDVMTRDGRVTRIERWLPFAAFKFLPDLKGRFYGMGWGKLLEPIQDSADTLINQLLDAGTAEIAGGGFIAGGVRLQGSGQGGVVTFQPGEYVTANVAAGTLQESIWERTVPRASPVGFQLLELMLQWGKEITSTQDVVTGDAPSNAPVGTTFALQNQALMGYRAAFKRMFRGFKDEFRLMYLALKKWATDKERKEYAELTGGNLDEDFSGDGTDIQPIADPSVVTKMQKMARDQAISQLAESPVGMAAGMTQPAQAQAIVRDILVDMDTPEPDQYIGQVQPNPLEIAKAQDMASSAQLKGAQAQVLPVKTQIEAEHLGLEAARATADNGLVHAQTLREIGLAATDTHNLTKEADRIAQTGNVADAESLVDPVEEAEKDRAAGAKKAAAKK